MPSDNTPLDLHGTTGSEDRKGLLVLRVPWWVSTVAEALTFRPDFRDFPGVSYVGREFEQSEEGGYKVTFLLEGGGSDDPESAAEYALEPSTAENAIELHPDFDEIAEKFVWDPQAKEFLEYVPTLVRGTGLHANDIDEVFKRSPMYGVTKYLEFEAVYRRKYTIKRGTRAGAILRGVQQIWRRPPGIGNLGDIVYDNRDFLKMMPGVVKRGDVTTVDEMYLMSGPDGWNDRIYRRYQ